MLKYSVLFEEDNYVYVSMCHNGENIKMTVTEYSEWAKGKMEI